MTAAIIARQTVAFCCRSVLPRAKKDLIAVHHRKNAENLLRQLILRGLRTNTADRVEKRIFDSLFCMLGTADSLVTPRSR